MRSFTPLNGTSTVLEKIARIHTAQAAEKIDVIVLGVAQDEPCGNGVLGLSMTQFGAKACALKSRAQPGQVRRRREEKNIHVC
jgi:GH24 family phage-related lysozyme (muramidase)